MTKALHTTSNYFNENYQRFIRIFSLQLKEQPIQITMKQMFTFNNSLLKSVSTINLYHFTHSFIPIDTEQTKDFSLSIYSKI